MNLDRIVLGEFAENEVRKDFTPSERVAILGAIETKPEEDQVNSQNIASSDEAAKAAGLGNRENARQAKNVVEDGVLELVEARTSEQTRV